MSAHTPGPWYVNTDPALSDLAICAESRGTGWGSSVAVCHDREGFKPLPRLEAEANARLVAAAPDMLKALEAVVRVADRATVEFDAARAAIAKATGSAA